MNLNKENKFIVKQSIKIIAICIVIFFVFFMFLFLIDKKVDHTKIDKLPWTCELLGEKHVLSKINKEHYYLYLFNINEEIQKDINVTGNLEKKYYIDATWNLKNSKQVKHYNKGIYFLSKNKNLKYATKKGIYKPHINDRIFIYEYKNLDGDSEYYLQNYSEMHNNFKKIKYIGILNEKNLKKYVTELLINPAYQNDYKYYYNYLERKKGWKL